MLRVVEWCSTRPVNSWEERAFEYLTRKLPRHFLASHNTILCAGGNAFPEIDILIIGDNDFYLIDCKDFSNGYRWTDQNLSMMSNSEIKNSNPFGTLEHNAKPIRNTIKDKVNATSRLGIPIVLLPDKSLKEQNLSELNHKQRDRVCSLKELVLLINRHEEGSPQILNLTKSKSLFDNVLQQANKLPNSEVVFSEGVPLPELPQLSRMFNVFDNGAKGLAFFYSHPPQQTAAHSLKVAREDNAYRVNSKLRGDLLLPKFNFISPENKPGWWCLLNTTIAHTLNQMTKRLPDMGKADIDNTISAVFDWIELIRGLHQDGWEINRFENLGTFQPNFTTTRMCGTLLDLSWLTNSDGAMSEDIQPFSNVLMQDGSICKKHPSTDWKLFSNEIADLINGLYKRLEIEGGPADLLDSISQLRFNPDTAAVYELFPSQIRIRVTYWQDSADPTSIVSRISTDNQLSQQLDSIRVSLPRGVDYVASCITELSSHFDCSELRLHEEIVAAIHDNEEEITDWRDTISENADPNEIGSALRKRLSSSNNGSCLPPFESMYNPQTTGMKGRWGEIYQVYPIQGRSGAPRALKLVRNDLPASDVGTAVTVWETECQAARKIINSGITPINIVRFFEVPDEDDENPYWIVMDWIHGAPMSENHLGGKLDVFKTIPIISSITSAIKMLKDNGVNYLDIHPSNIILRDEIYPTLIDPAACLPRFCPPEWSGIAVTDILKLLSSEVEAGQVFLIANLMLDIIFTKSGDTPLGEALDSFAAGHFENEPNDYEDDAGLVLLQEKTQDYLRMHHTSRSRIPEPDIEKFSSQLASLLYYSTSKHPEDRPSTLDSFNDSLQNLMRY